MVGLQGARNKASLMAEQLFIDDIQGICESVVSQAKSGNIQAAKIILDRLFPASKDRPISIELPSITTSHDILKAVGAIVQAVAHGEISPLEGEALAKIIQAFAQVLQSHEFDQRLSTLEQKAIS